jgi:hypothetical protein
MITRVNLDIDLHNLNVKRAEEIIQRVRAVLLLNFPGSAPNIECLNTEGFNEDMTVGELMQNLHTIKRDAPIKVTWEGTTQSLNPESIYVTPDGTVIIDADKNRYKESFLNGSLKP